jgi:aminoacrylate hydrolase
LIHDTRLVATALGPLSVTVTGDGPPLVLIAGLGGRGAFWLRFQSAAARRFRTITFDHPGCGNSPPSSVVPSTIDLSAHVLALLDALEIDRASIVGHSMGGAITQHLAVSAPHRVEQLVLSATWAGPDAWFSALFDARLEILERLGPAAYLQNGSALGNPGWWAQENFDETSKTLATRLDAFPGLALERQRIAAVVNHDARSALAAIRAPTLVITAQDDAITPTGFAVELAERIPEATLKILAKGGHFAPQTVPNRYQHAVLQFLATNGASRPKLPNEEGLDR